MLRTECCLAIRKDSSVITASNLGEGMPVSAMGISEDRIERMSYGLLRCLVTLGHCRQRNPPIHHCAILLQCMMGDLRHYFVHRLLVLAVSLLVLL
jgi:hypothetical protein